MKITIQSDTEYQSKDSPPIESFDLTIEGETMDSPDDVAKVYLDLRGQLRKGIGKEDK